MTWPTLCFHSEASQREFRLHERRLHSSRQDASCQTKYFTLSLCTYIHVYTYLSLLTLHQTLFSRLAVSCRCSWKITWEKKRKKKSLIEVRERICRINSMTKTRFDLAAWKTFTQLGPTAGGQMKFRLRFTCPPACRRLKRGAPLLQLHHLFHRGSGIWPEKLKTWQKEQISLRGHERHFDVTFFFFFC